MDSGLHSREISGFFRIVGLQFVRRVRTLEATWICAVFDFVGPEYTVSVGALPPRLGSKTRIYIRTCGHLGLAILGATLEWGKHRIEVR